MNPYALFFGYRFVFGFSSEGERPFAFFITSVGLLAPRGRGFARIEHLNLTAMARTQTVQYTDTFVGSGILGFISV